MNDPTRRDWWQLVEEHLERPPPTTTRPVLASTTRGVTAPRPRRSPTSNGPCSPGSTTNRRCPGSRSPTTRPTTSRRCPGSRVPPGAGSRRRRARVRTGNMPGDSP